MMDTMKTTLAAPQRTQSSGNPVTKREQKSGAKGFDHELTQAGATAKAELAKDSEASKKSKDSGDAAKAGAQGVAAHVAMAQSQAMALATAKAAEPAREADPAHAAANSAEGANPTHLIPTDAEKLTLNPKTAASMNTAGAIAGLHPWSKDWVFRGGEENDSQLKTLLPSDHEKALLDSKAALNKSEIEAQGMQIPGAAGAEALSRGDARVAALGSQAVMAAGSKPGNAREVKKGEQVSPLENHAAQATAALDVNAALAAQLAELNGLVEGTSEGFNGKELGRSNQNAKTAAGPLGAGLSGAEFMRTLEGVKDGAQQSAQAGPARAIGRNLRMVEGGLNEGKTGDQIGMQDRIPGRPEMGKPVSLNAITGGANEAALAAAAAGMAGKTQGAAGSGGMKEVTGHVVQGTMARDRLSSESLLGMGTGIRELTAQGGGEMRVRLNPDNLGELHLKVVTKGNDVGLQIRASDERAKAILQESMSHLKESLATHNLTLGSVDLSVSNSASNMAGNHANQDSGRQDWNGQQQPGQGFDLARQSRQEGEQGNQSRYQSGNDDSGAPVIRMPSRAAASSAMTGTRRVAGAGAGRLDVMV